jgi:predicted aspartyl protease
MIKGKFINDNVPIIKVTIASDRAVQTPYFILDTGFTGDLQVTTEVANELGLKMNSVTRTCMASGEIITVPTALAFSKMEGKKKSGECFNFKEYVSCWN